MTVPYVISNDIASASRAFERFAGVKCPSDKTCAIYGDELKKVLRAIFPSVDVVPDKEMRDFYKSVARRSVEPLVSMYSSSLPGITRELQTSRGVDENLQSIGIIPRHKDVLPRDQQIKNICSNLTVSYDGAPFECPPFSKTFNTVSLIDDVLFTGGSVLEAQKAFAAQGVSINKVYVPIAIRKGVERVRKAGIEVEFARIYDEVVDEICGRDISPGLFEGGRTCRTSKGDYFSIPYLQSYGGNPEKWASIPKDRISEFDRGCEEIAAAWWQATAKLTGRLVQDNEIGRPLLKGSVVTLQTLRI